MYCVVVVPMHMHVLYIYVSVSINCRADINHNVFLKKNIPFLFIWRIRHWSTMESLCLFNSFFYFVFASFWSMNG